METLINHYLGNIFLISQITIYISLLLQFQIFSFLNTCSHFSFCFCTLTLFLSRQDNFLVFLRHLYIKSQWVRVGRNLSEFTGCSFDSNIILVDSTNLRILMDILLDPLIDTSVSIYHYIS